MVLYMHYFQGWMDGRRDEYNEALIEYDADRKKTYL